MEFQVDNINYRAIKLDARAQFHLARRLSPVLAAFVSGAESGDQGRMLLAVASALSTMSDDQADYVIDKCMSAVQRQQKDTWVPVSSSGGRLMFDDIQLTHLIQISAQVIRHNLGNSLADVAGALAQMGLN